MTRYQVPEAVLRAPLDEDEVMLNAKSGMYHMLNPTAKAILSSLEEGLSVDEAARKVSVETGESFDRVLQDSQVFVSALLERGLLETPPE